MLVFVTMNCDAISGPVDATYFVNVAIICHCFNHIQNLHILAISSPSDVVECLTNMLRVYIGIFVSEF